MVGPSESNFGLGDWAVGLFYGLDWVGFAAYDEIDNHIVLGLAWDEDSFYRFAFDTVADVDPAGRVADTATCVAEYVAVPLTLNGLPYEDATANQATLVK